MPLIPALLLTAAALLLALLVQLLHFEGSISRTMCWARKHPGPWSANAAIYLAWLALWSSMMDRVGTAVLLAWAIALGLALVNNLMLRYRKRPFFPEDLPMARNVTQIAHMIRPVTVALVLLFVLFMAAAVIVLDFLEPPLPAGPRQRMATGVLFFLLLLLLARRARRRVDLSRYGNNVPGAYDEQGYLLAFLAHMGAPLMAEPKGYSHQALERLPQQYPSADGPPSLSGEGRPDVILILSESFYDPLALPGLRWDADPIPNVRALMGETPSGSLLATGYGGGTAECECELLTGLSTALCGDSNLYASRIAGSRDFPSLVSDFRSEGYRALALHPYNNTMYNRVEAYRDLGFADFICHDRMTHQGRLDRNPYISDSEAFAEALDLLEGSEQPVLLHLITMQNHMNGAKDRFRNTLRVEGTDPHTVAVLESQAQGLRYTDEAVAELLSQLKGRERPAVVLFYGDHLPGGYPANFFPHKDLAAYRTPFLLWYSRGGGGELKLPPVVSPFHLGAILKEFGGMPLTPFDHIRRTLRDGVPALHMDFWVDRQGRRIGGSPPSQTPGWADYRMAQYSLLEDNMPVPGLFHPPQTAPKTH